LILLSARLIGDPNRLARIAEGKPLWAGRTSDGV